MFLDGCNHVGLVLLGVIEEAQESRAPIQQWDDRFSAIYTPVMLMTIEPLGSEFCGHIKGFDSLQQVYLEVGSFYAFTWSDSA